MSDPVQYLDADSLADRGVPLEEAVLWGYSGPGWGFWDETWAYWHGGYGCEREARDALKTYTEVYLD